MKLSLISTTPLFFKDKLIKSSLKVVLYFTVFLYFTTFGFCGVNVLGYIDALIPFERILLFSVGIIFMVMTIKHLKIILWETTKICKQTKKQV